jgi:hypothetical protein
MSTSVAVQNNMGRLRSGVNRTCEERAGDRENTVNMSADKTGTALFFMVSSRANRLKILNEMRGLYTGDEEASVPRDAATE